LALKGDVDVNAIFAGSLPSTHPSFAPQRNLEMSNKWKTRPLPNTSIDLFIGVLSAGNHFAERMAVRKSWMQYDLIKSSQAVARFFVALVSINPLITLSDSCIMCNLSHGLIINISTACKKGSERRTKERSRFLWRYRDRAVHG